MGGEEGAGEGINTTGCKNLETVHFKFFNVAYCSNPPSSFEAFKPCYLCLGWGNVHELHQG